MGFSGRTGHRSRWRSRCKGAVVGTCLDCSAHNNHHVPTGLAEKVGAEQLEPKMEMEGYRTYRGQVFQVVWFTLRGPNRSQVKFGNRKLVQPNLHFTVEISSWAGDTLVFVPFLLCSLTFHSTQQSLKKYTLKEFNNIGRGMAQWIQHA